MGEIQGRYVAAVARPRIWARRAGLAVLAIAGAGVLVFVLHSPRELDCKTASATAGEGIVVTVCQREYERTKSPADGARLADALYLSGNLQAAEALANDLLATEASANAHHILGKIAFKQKRTEDATRLLAQARQMHREQGDHTGVARDDEYLTLIHEDAERFAEALQTIEEGISEARVAHDTRTEAYCHLYAARVLMNVGYFEACHQELDRASEQMSSDRDLAQLWRLRGDLEQEFGRGPVAREHYLQAVGAFQRSLEHARRAQFTTILVSLHLNLAYSLAELDRTDEADRHLAEAGVLDRSGVHQLDRQQIAARIAYHRKNYSLAWTLNEQVYPQLTSHDDEVEIAVMQTRIALANRDVAAAIAWAQRGVATVEQIRAAQTLGELRPWVLATRREPFELLFTTYARSEPPRVEDAIVVFDQWQGRTLLDKMAQPSPEPSPALSSTAARVQSLGRWLPVVSKAPLMAYDGRAVLTTLRRVDLVALAVADGHVWRLTALHGQYALKDLGTFADLRELLARFVSAPTNAALADELGARLLPDEVMRKTTDSLYVVLDAPFAALPFVALRRNGQPVIAVRPVLRTPRLPVASGCAVASDRRSAVVLADAVGDLPDARRESSKVASLFGATPLVGAQATSTALFAAKSDPLLHIAVHAEVDAGGGVLKLHDRAVSAAEISANRLGPNLVVLAACSTARSGDPELVGSLSTAFLAGGSEHVVATLRSVSDDGALELTSRFYEARGNTDPVGVLARIQAGLATTDNKEWPNFAVFGNEICKQ
jgi:CHAT domain-containing protein